VRKHVIEAGGLLGANQELARLLQRWLERNGQLSSGVILIGLHEDGFDLQYMGSEQLDERGLEDRVLWLARHIQSDRLADAIDRHGPEYA